MWNRSQQADALGQEVMENVKSSRNDGRRGEYRNTYIYKYLIILEKSL